MEDHEIMALGIDLGLSMLFNENRAAMEAWMNKPRPAFDGLSAAELMSSGKLADAQRVNSFLDLCRNLT